MKPRSRKVEAVSHGPFSINITMDERGIFHAKQGALFTVGTLLEVRAWCRETLRELCQLKWIPVMEVSFEAEDDCVNNLKNSSNIGCYMERYWIAWTGAKWIQTPWVVQRPGTYICSPHATSEETQPEMPDSDLMAERIRQSRDFYHAPEHSGELLVWPIKCRGHRSNEFVVPYTEEHWATMLAILDKIRALRSGLDNLFSSMQGWGRLALIASAQSLLPAPQQNE